MNLTREHLQVSKTPIESEKNSDSKLPEFIDVNEIISPTTTNTSGQDDPIRTTPTPGFLNFNIRNKIKRLLQSKKQDLKLPKTKIQKIKIKKAITKETDKLLKEAKKIVRKRRFSAYKLENIVNKIRYLQKILEEIVSATVDRIESLYRQYVLKIS